MRLKPLKLSGLGGTKLPSLNGVIGATDVDKLLKRIQQKQTIIKNAGQSMPQISNANTTLQDVMDFIARPSHASAAFANWLATNNGSDKILKALEGQDKTTYSDVLGSLGMPEGAPRAILGFIGDILGDPLTYVGVGAIGDAAKAAELLEKVGPTEKFLKFAGKPIASLAPIGEKIAPIGKALYNTKPGELFEKLFQHGNETPLYQLARNNPEEYSSKINEFLNSMEGHLNAQKFESAQAVKSAEDMIKKHTPKELETIGTKPTSELPENLQAARQLFSNGFKEMAAKEKELGVLGSEIEDYMPRMARKRGITGRFAEGRKYDTFEEFSKALEEHGLEPIKNAAVLYAMRGVASARAISTKQIIDDAIRIFGTPLEDHLKLGRLTAQETKAIKALGQKNTQLLNAQGALNKAVSQSLEFGIPKETTKGLSAKITPQLYVSLPKKVRAEIAGSSLEDAVGRGDATLRDVADFLKSKNIAVPKSIYGAAIPETIAKPKNAKDIFDAISLKKVGTITSGKQLAKNIQAAKAGKFKVEQKLNEISQAIKSTNPTIPQGYAVFQTLTGGKLYAMPEQVAGFLNNFKQQFLSDEAAKEVANIYFKTLNVWKGYATAVNPGFHGRNLLSNIWQNFLAGVKNPKVYKDALFLQAGKTDIKIGKYTGEQIVDMAKRNGVLGHGWVGSDIEQYLADILSGKGKFNPASQNFTLLKKGRQAGTAIEDNARLAHFIDRLQKGYSPEAAAASVKKFLFDYQELTPFERNAMKGVVPFFVWLRKNIPLQIEQLVKQPGKFAAIPKAKQEIENLSPEINETSLPDWLRELYGIRLPIKTKSGQPLFINPNLPFQDLGKITDTKDWLSSLTPALKIPLEVLTNQQFYWGTPIESFPGQTKIAPGFFSYFPKAVRDKLGITMQRQSDGSMKPLASPWISYAFQQIPFLNSLGKAVQAGDKSAFDKLSWLVGVKLLPIDEAQVKKQNLQNYEEKLQSLVDQIERQQDSGIAPNKNKKKNQNMGDLLNKIRRQVNVR